MYRHRETFKIYKNDVPNNSFYFSKKITDCLCSGHTTGLPLQKTENRDEQCLRKTRIAYENTSMHMKIPPFRVCLMF